MSVSSSTAAFVDENINKDFGQNPFPVCVNCPGFCRALVMVLNVEKRVDGKASCALHATTTTIQKHRQPSGAYMPIQRLPLDGMGTGEEQTSQTMASNSGGVSCSAQTIR